jgi:hypothetical protein
MIGTPVTPGLLFDIKCAVVKLYRGSTAPQMRYANCSKALEWLDERWCRRELYVTGNYAVVAVPGMIWYSSDSFLMEQLVIKFRDTEDTPIDSVPLLLEEIARKEGCAAVISGDAQRGLMEPVYTRAGFVPVGRQFIKDV